MIQITKTNEKGKLDYIYFKNDEDDVVNYEILKEKNTWINLTAPTEEEIEALEIVLDIPQEHLRAALDEEEKSRLEIDGDIILIIIDIPIHNDGDDKCSFTTIPLGIILLQDNIITVTIDKFPLIDEFIKG